MKEPYTPAKLELIEFETEDIIITSSQSKYKTKKSSFVEYYDLDEEECPQNE